MHIGRQKLLVYLLNILIPIKYLYKSWHFKGMLVQLLENMKFECKLGAFRNVVCLYSPVDLELLFLFDLKEYKYAKKCYEIMKVTRDYHKEGY